MKIRCYKHTSRAMDAIADAMNTDYRPNVMIDGKFYKRLGNTTRKTNKELFEAFRPLLEGGIGNIETIKKAKGYLGTPLFEIN